jgi:hypothetical protein
LLSEVAGRAEVGSEGWCTAQYWLGYASLHSADPVRALRHFTAVRDAVGDRGPSRALADCLGGRSAALVNMGRVAEAADEGHRSLALARELGYPLGQTQALAYLSMATVHAGDADTAVQLARQAAQIQADIPDSVARWNSYLLTVMLDRAGDPGRRRAYLRGGRDWPGLGMRATCRTRWAC